MESSSPSASQRNAKTHSYAFVSGMSGEVWGGSEVLWSQSALRLLERGNRVFASVKAWPQTPEPVKNLSRAGMEIEERRARKSDHLWNTAAKFARKAGLRVRPWSATSHSFERIKSFSPDLVCVSHGSCACGLDWMEWCLENQMPYVSLSQANSENWWPPDGHADRLAKAHAGALVSCFVSQANQTMLEEQIGQRLANARVVWNPVQVISREPLPWPDSGEGIRLACVGRLDPRAKGQDLILKVLSLPIWQNRPVTVSFYGEGPMKNSLQRLAGMLGVADKVFFHGHSASVDSIWRDHHALLLTSRFEGLPLAVIEAMLCGKPVIVTDVAGNREVVVDNETGFLAPAPTTEFVHQTMERAWNRREEWMQIGLAASISMKEKLPDDPAGEFADLLTGLR